MLGPLSIANPPVAIDTTSLRADGRRPDQLRPIRFQNQIAPYATGSTLIEWGNTRVICGVTVEDTVPRWMKEQNVNGGWTAGAFGYLNPIIAAILHNAGSLVVVFNSARLVRLGEELEPFQAVATDPTDKGPGRQVEPAAQLAPRPA